MLKTYISITLMIVSFSLSAQEKSNELDQIKSTIENYFDGYVERDGEKLNKAFSSEKLTSESLKDKGENSFFA